MIAELAFGIRTIRPDERAQRLADGLEAWRSRFAGRLFALTEEAALSYGERMGEAARRVARSAHPTVGSPPSPASTRRRWRRGTWRTFARRAWCWWIRGGAERGDVSKQNLTFAL
ncbi:hypothetical protein [uncultured Aquimonas sp.]|uniref:hypothetical protein n=1 Tax=uncultured Aquimonas sp. TaxID=385483 RepID=UPI002633648D|nr:hypothetical protein [uncultured Aquimonas sp.]